MKTHDKAHYESLMLDNLYGLLESEQVKELDAYLAGPDGERLKALAEGWKAKLTRAASSSFPDVKFQPPKEPAAKPATQPATQPVKRSRRFGWAIAASLLAAGAAVGVPAAREYARYATERNDLAYWKSQHENAEKARMAYAAKFSEEEKKYKAAAEAAAQEIQKASTDFGTLRKSLEDRLAQREMIVKLTGPERPMPGAPNEWSVATLDKNAKPIIPAKLEMAVKTQAGRVIHSQTVEKPATPPRFKMPVAAWNEVKLNDTLALEVTATKDENVSAKLTEKLTLAKPVFVTHLATDKPLYKPGETVYYRSLTLERSTLIPPTEDQHLAFKLVKPDGSEAELAAGNGRVRDEKSGKLLAINDQQALRGIGCGDFVLPPESPGGEYKLVVSDNGRKLEERKFIVNQYVPDKFFKKLEFDGKSYGPGDSVQIRAEAKRTENALVKAPIVVTGNMDGKPIEINAPKTTDENGVVNLKFNLPQEIKDGSGSISIAFNDGSGPETITRPIPVIGTKLDVDFYPEGGDLVAGVPNRVYFQAKTPAGKPADLKGQLTDGTATVAEVQTLTDAEQAGVNRGQGTFTFTPTAGKNYFLKLERPLNIKTPQPEGFPLPAVKSDGVVLTTLDDITAGGKPIRVQVTTPTKERKLVVGAYGRGRLIDHQIVAVNPKQPMEVQLGKESDLGGVVRVTVFEEKTDDAGRAELMPVAERLVYRKQPHNLILNVHPDKARYNPGAKVGLELSALGDKEQPTPAVLMVAVVNQSVITMADNKTDRLMPTHFLLAGEVKKPEDLEHADFLLSDNPKAPKALDLLLGTQGWRRFAEQNVNAFVGREKEEAERLLVSTGLKPVKIPDPIVTQYNEARNHFQPLLQDAQADQAKAAVELTQFFARVETGEEYTKLRQKEEEAKLSEGNAQAVLAGFYADLSERYYEPVMIALVIVSIITVSLLLYGFLSKLKTSGSANPLVVGGLVGLALVGVLLYLLAGPLGAVKPGRFDNVAAKVGSAPDVSREIAPAAGEAIPVDDLDRHLRMKANRDAGGAAWALRKEANALEDRLARLGAAVPPPVAAMPAPPAGPGGGMPGRGGFGGGEKAGLGGPKGGMQLGGGGGGRAMRPGAAQAPQDLAKLKMMEAGKPMRGLEGNLQQLRDADRKQVAPFARGNARLADEPEGLKKRQRDAFGLAVPAGDFEKKIGEMNGEGRTYTVTELQEIETGQVVKVTKIEIPSSSFIVREYAHTKAADKGDLRDDFTETVFWHPVIVLPRDGKAKVEFDLADDVARFQVLVAAHTLDGMVAASVTHIDARKPFSVDPKMPVEVSSSDTIEVPVRVVNDSDEKREVKFAIIPKSLELLPSTLRREGDNWVDSLKLEANEKGRAVYAFKPSLLQGELAMKLLATSPGADADNIERKIAVVPDGFPVVGQVSDLLEKKAMPAITLPGDILPGTLKVTVNLYPSTLADLQKGLDGLLREPSGCFEQTSTSNYPNTLILDYLNTSDQANPEASKRAKDLLDRGYQKLTSFECLKPTSDGRMGYEWFGGSAPPHEALTAYGLLQFIDMSRVHQVDPVMIERTRNYLLGQRDGKGGFKRNARALDTFGRAPAHVTDAYIVWALTESDLDNKAGMDLKLELEALKEKAKTEDDPYFLGLVANAFLNRGMSEDGIAILKKIAGKQKKPEGVIPGAQTSITASGGRDLEIETTAMAVLGFLKANKPDLFTEPLQLAIKWIGQQRGGYGGFGSTQSTILALKAVIAYTKDQKRMPEGGTLTFFVNDKKVGEKVFSAADREAIVLDVLEPEKVFAKGENKNIRVELDTKQSLPYTLMWECRTLKPLSDDKCALALETKLDRTDAKEGDTLKLNVKLTNKLDKGHGMTVAVLGMPAGAKVPTDMKQLTKLREDGKISYFEIRGRELVIYWRELAPKAEIDLGIDLVCDAPGNYRGPASRAYLYYNADHKAWVDPLAVTIKAE